MSDWNDIFSSRIFSAWALEHVKFTIYDLANRATLNMSLVLYPSRYYFSQKTLVPLEW